jgi:hypothetical protein
MIVIPVKRNGTFGDQEPPEQEEGVAERVGCYWKGQESEQDIVDLHRAQWRVCFEPCHKSSLSVEMSPNFFSYCSTLRRKASKMAFACGGFVKIRETK